MNFSLVAITTFFEGCSETILFPMAWIRWVLPRPTPPYIIKGLKELSPGFSATVCAAVFANWLLLPSINDSNVKLLFSVGPFVFCVFFAAYWVVFLDPGIGFSADIINLGLVLFFVVLLKAFIRRSL